MVTIHELVAAISNRAEQRYKVALTDTVEAAMAPPEIDCQVLQLKRINQESAGWRTVLITALPFETLKIQTAFRWAADVRDMLPEPQTADLYMFMLFDNIPSEDAARIETDDRFCRKVVVREEEEVGSFLDRSFLACLSPTGSSEDISDPLLAALGSLELKHPWVEPHINTWRELLLSGTSASDIADALKASVIANEETR